MSQQTQRRYPGLNYFTTAQKAQFFGRDEEIEELLSLILSEKIVALFGKSGYGKSSLLRAGILPALDAGISPVFVQLGAYQPGQSPTPVETTLSWLDRTLEDNPESAFLDALGDANTLWHRFKRKQSAERQRFLLVFDQFEEFDSYPAEQKTAFKQQLAELLFTRIPQALRDRSDALTDEQQNLLARAPEIKAVFAIREDRLGVLDGLADKLPAILHKRYRLRGLSDAQAREAVLRPAALPQNTILSDPPTSLGPHALPVGAGRGGVSFESPSFAYSPAALDALLQGLKKDEAGADTRIEAFLLQICCEYLEKKVIERGQVAGVEDKPVPDNIVIQPADLPVFNRLFEEYYRGKIAALPDEAARAAARRMIEDELVKADPATGIAYRINVDGRQLAKLTGMSEALLKRLTDDFLLRSEPNTTGGFSYEVSHDRLVEGILNAKLEYEAEQARLAAEREAREEAARLQAEAEAARQREAEARLREQEAERRRRRATLLAVGAGGAALLAIGLLVFAVVQQSRLRAISGKVVENLLADANDMIYHLEYDEAWNKAGDAAQLGERKAEVAQVLFEIAYFYGEAGIWNKALPAAGQAAGMFENNTIQEQLKNCHVSDSSGRALFRSILGRLDTARLAALDARYFPKMIDIPGGTDTLGSNEDDDNFLGDARPPLTVTLSPFKIARTETTWWQYVLFCSATKRAIPEKPGWSGEGDNPVVNVDWYDAIAYANWLSQKKGFPPAISGTGDSLTIRLRAGYRLPTEAEWEYAARAGTHFTYSGSDTLDSVGWYEDNSGGRTHPVARKKANAFGLYDMSGNVYEWCWDWYGAYSPNPLTDPTGPVSGGYRVYRGGRWSWNAQNCRPANRSSDQPRLRYDGLGFRLVSSL